MSDFLRLNLNSSILILSFLTIFTIAFFLIYRSPRLSEENKRQARKGFFWIMIIMFFVIVFSLLTQLSVNVLPKQEIDRSFTLETQKNYQQTLKEREKSYEDSLKAEKDTL